MKPQRADRLMTCTLHHPDGDKTISVEKIGKDYWFVVDGKPMEAGHRNGIINDIKENIRIHLYET